MVVLPCFFRSLQQSVVADFRLIGWRKRPCLPESSRMRRRTASSTIAEIEKCEAAAIETLNERPVIPLDDEDYAVLDAPVEPDDRLKKRWARRPLWER